MALTKQQAETIADSLFSWRRRRKRRHANYHGQGSPLDLP